MRIDSDSMSGSMAFRISAPSSLIMIVLNAKTYLRRRLNSCRNVDEDLVQFREVCDVLGGCMAARPD